MKRLHCLLVMTSVFSLVFLSIIGCKKTDKTDDPTPLASLTCRLRTIVDGAELGNFFYRSSGKIDSLVQYSLPTGNIDYVYYVTYNSNGKISEIEQKDASSDIITFTYAYTDGLLSSIEETDGVYTATTVITYGSNKLPTSIVTTGHTDPDQNQSFTDIVYVNGNISTATLSGFIELSATSDNKTNLAKSAFLPLPSSLIESFNKNNIVEAVTVNDENIPGIGSVPAGSHLVDRVNFSYDGNRVLGYTENPTVFEATSKIVNADYSCIF